MLGEKKREAPLFTQHQKENERRRLKEASMLEIKHSL